MTLPNLKHWVLKGVGITRGYKYVSITQPLVFVNQEKTSKQHIKKKERRAEEKFSAKIVHFT